MNIGDNIKRKREHLGITRAELIERSGVSTAQLSRLERGEQKNPNLETLVAISTALNCSIDELVFGEESPNSAYIAKAIDSLPEDRKAFIKELIKLTIMSAKTSEFEKEMGK
ncbi:helix-turn-helix domain-containing protein [Vibrio fluvialis]|uniref:helix-turn-helix domain-containing protein n=1 Tax=Vibrio fluvialis TaxID=676 RepID=UPI001F20205B|nr:helix-turn-helix transcriptional regulator [Vibrio fluvialis]MCE7614665.1 helix-turn-helix domain-containing protein [Vibrio fluvialis]